MLHWPLMSPVVLDLSPLISKMFEGFLTCVVLSKFPQQWDSCWPGPSITLNVFFFVVVGKLKWEFCAVLESTSSIWQVISHHPQTLSDMMYSWLREWLQAVLFLKQSIYSPTFDSSVHSTFCHHTWSFPVWLLERCSFPQSSFWIANFSSEGWIHAPFFCVYYYSNSYRATCRCLADIWSS